MPSEFLNLVLPDWSGLDTVRRSSIPFALWTIGDQCLLHHWLDYAVNQGVSTVRVYAADRPASVRRVLEDSTLWPIKTEFTAIASTGDAPADSISADWLPGLTSPPPPTDGWTLIERAAELEKAWLDRLAAEPDFNLLSIGYSCRIHPDATLIPPYFIGDHVLIGPDSEIGPHAVIGDGSVIAGGNRISSSHLSAHSFLGPMTALENCLLDGGVLFNLKHQARLDNIEPHLLSTLEKSTTVVPFRDRLKALYLYLKLGAPLASHKLFTTFDGQQLPGEPDASLRTRISWLPLVWKGRLPLYGVLPRTEEQFSALLPDWQNVLRHSPIGVFSYADSQGAHTPDHPEEALHAVYQSSLPSETLIPSIAQFIRSLKSSDLSNSSPSR